MANQIIARGDQPSQPGTGWTENASGLGRFATAAGATIASGFIPTAGGGRMWDKYINTIRGVETGFPAAILRTFRTSEFLSPLESWKEIDVNAPHLKGGKYAEFLKNSFGPVEGLSMKRTGHVFGEVTDQLGKTVGYGLQIEAGTSKGVSIADYYARVTGTPLTQHASLNDALLRTMYKEANVPISFERWKQSMEPHLRRQRLILGAKLRSKLSVMGKDIKLTSEMAKNVAKLETTGQLLRAKAASTAGRLNILLKAPLDFPVIKEVFSKIPGLRSMAVKPGTNIDFMRRLAWKGAMAGAAWKGLEYVDYLRSESSPWAAVFGTAGGAGLGGLLARKSGTKFSKAGMLAGAAFGLFSSVAPRFEEGLFHGLVSVATDAKVTQAELSEKMGFAESLRRQEEISPGMTNPTTGLAFGLIAGLGTGLYSYGSFMKEAISKKAPGQPIYQVMESLRETRSTEFAEKVWGSKLGKKIKRMPGLKALAKIKSPMALGFTAGFAAWQGISSATAIMSGNLLAAIPGASLFATSDDPQELRDIYSGRKEVAVRKGRWWEFGRCLLQDTEIITEFGSYTDAKNIKVDDVVLSSTGRLSKVKHVWEREYEGLAYYIYTSLDKNLSTGMTGNHKVPVLVKDKKNFSLCEKEASKINVGEYVRVPIPELSEDLLELKTKEFIKVGRYLIYNNTILPAQINWHNKKIQQSHGASLKENIELNSNIGRLFGYFLAEGNLSYNQNNLPCMIETVHAKSERWIVDDILLICEKELTITPTVRFKKGKKKTDEGCWIVRICSSLLARVFYELFYNSDKNQDKIFPKEFLSTSVLFKEHLTEAYWRGDGHSEKNAKIISSCRKDFLVKIQAILFSLGYYPTIGRFESNDYRGRYRLRWDKDKRYRGRGFKGSFIWNEDSLYVKVEQIRIKEYFGLVYDFEVSDPDHLFVAGTFLVHNSSGYEGGRIEYYRPHFLHRLRTRAFQKGIYGDESEKWDYDPMLHPLKALFGSDDWKYHYEKKHQYDRPAPLTGTHGEDVPFVGPLIAATFGKLFKPRKMVRPEEWNLGDGEYVHQPDPRGETEPVYDLGGLKPGAPVLPEEGSQLLNELNYRRREAVGLVGFAEGAITKSILGREEFLENKQTFGTMGKETGSEYWWWSHLDLGGGAGTCFVSGTPVKTSSGMKPIEQISKGDLVLGIDGYCPVVNILEKKPTEQFHEIEVKESGTKIICTKNHWIPILRRERYKKGHLKPFKDNNYKIIEVQAIDIKEEDYLFYPIDEHISREKIDLSNPNKAVTSKYVYHQASNDFAVAYEMLEKNSLLSRKRLRESGIPDLIAKEVLRQFRLGQTPKRANRFIKIDKDIAFAIGWYIAEGSSDKGKITYTMHANELNYARMIKETFKQLGYHGKIRIKNNTLRLNIYSSLFAQYFKVFGKNSHEKCIPKRFQSLEQDMLYSLVSGLMLGDGWGELDPNKGPGGFTSVSKQLTKDLFHCLLRLGIQSYLTTDYLEISQGMMPQGTPRKDHIRNYLKIKKGRQNWKFFENTYLVRVTKSKSIARDDIVVYDLTVKDLHYYTADGVLVHNTEAIRRFIPRTRSYLDRYNPIKNQLPSWLPNDYFLDLKHGNPFEKIKEAEIRLPGPGYESLYPELEGLSPEEYPLAHRVKILGDVAMYSKKYRDTLTVAKSQLQNMSEKEAWLIKQTDRQVKEKKKRKNFQPYVFNEKLLKQESVNVTEVLSPRRFKTKEYGDLMLEIQGIGAITHPDAALEMMKNTIEGKEIDIYTPSMDDRRYGKVVAGSRMKVVPMIGGKDLGAILAEERITEEGALEDEFKQIRFSPMERLAGSFSEKMLHNLETPIEYLTPLSPASKLVRQRSAVEDYIASEAIGTGSSFWDKPIQNFLRPAFDMSKHRLGITSIPENVEERRNLNEYFDMLQWTKMSRLEIKSRQEGNNSLAAGFKHKRESTVFGTDVFDSPVNIMKALPRRERDYFGQFLGAKSEEERSQILELIPENEKRIYLSQWLRQSESAAYAKRQAKIDTEEDNDNISIAAHMRTGEGFSYGDAEKEQWLRETEGKIEFDEWLREQKAEEYFSSHSLPGADWIGWNPAVDLDDIKLVTVEMAGLDHHDFDLWGKRKMALARKPYINEEVIREMTQASEYQDSWIVAKNSEALAKMYGDHEARIEQSRIGADLGGPGYNIQVLDGREKTVEKAYKLMGA